MKDKKKKGKKKRIVLDESDIEFLKLMAKNRGEYIWLVQLFSNCVLKPDLLERMRNGDTSNSDLEVIGAFLELYNRANADLIAVLLKKIGRKSRLMLIESCEGSQVERYIFSLIYNLKKEGKRVRTSYILSLLEKNKGIDLEKEGGKYAKIINRVRKRVSYRLKKEVNCEEK